MLLQRIVLVLVSATACLNMAAQDYIVTWQDDTLSCRIIQHPAREGLRPASRYLNGYYRVAVMFPPDSLRIFQPGEIKAYYRSRHGRRLLCNGVFHAMKGFTQTGSLTNAEGKKDGYQWYFMLLEEKGPYASLYKIMFLQKRMNTWYFLVKHDAGSTPEARIVSGKKGMREQLSDPDIAGEMNLFIRKHHSYPRMVREYNRLKSIREKGSARLRMEGGWPVFPILYHLAQGG